MSTDYEIVMIPISEIFSDDDFNCRGQISPINVHSLAEDIQKLKLQTPITVQPKADVTDKQLPNGKEYRILAGHRRFKAWTVLQRSWHAGDPAQGNEPWDGSRGNPFDLIPCFVNKGLDILKARIINLSENLKREDLNILQEANAIKHLADAGMARDHVAAELGVSSGWVQTRYYLLDLPEDIQQECALGIVNQAQIKQLYTLRNDRDKQYEAVRAIKNAKVKGEKVGHVGERKKQPTTIKKERKKAEILQMSEIFAKTKASYGLHTRALAWAAGQISSEELFMDLRRWHTEHQFPLPSLPAEF